MSLGLYEPRPSGLPDEETVETLASMLAAGNYVSVAARAVGIDVDLLAEWMSRGVSSAPDDAPFVRLRARLDRARANAEVRAVAIIASEAATNWAAAAWLLERQYPDRWSRPTLASFRVEEEPPTYSADALDELAERRAVRRAASPEEATS